MRRKAVPMGIAITGLFAAAANMYLLLPSGQNDANEGAVLGSGTLSSDAQSPTSSDSAGTGASTGSSDASSSAGSESSDASSDAQSSSASSGLADGTYTGATISTDRGDVQLQVTVSGGTITKITALKYPNSEQRSISMSQTVIPQLSDAAVAAQSADIQMVSGATETSTGFIGSLQDALNQAKQS